MPEKPITIGTRGSALALAQANWTFDMLRQTFPRLQFEIKIIKTTGDKMKTASLAKVTESSKGLFIKELEIAMQRGQYDDARLLALRAEADARLAWTMAENARMQRALEQERSAR